MNKSELIKRIAENCDFSLQKAEVVVNVFLETISSKIAEGDSVKLLNFGRWYVKERLSRKSYNIATKSIETIPAKKVVVFSSSKNLLRQQVDIASVKVSPTSIIATLSESTTKMVHPVTHMRLGNCQNLKSVTIFRTGIKIDEEPNFGQRVKTPQTIESGDLNYCGSTSYYETKAYDTENYSYPAFLIPFYETPILEYRTNRYATGGVMEPVLFKALYEIAKIEPKIQILQNISVPVKNRTYGYKPDIAIVWREKNLFIDVEIDEPYDIISRTPIHYKGCSDSLRNAYFLDNGWSVVRIAEKQIVEDCTRVVEYIKCFVYLLTDDVRFKAERNICDIAQWSYSESQKWAEEDYRESYLGIEKTSTSIPIIDDDFDATEFAGIPYQGGQHTFKKPAEDILSDRYGELRAEITDVGRGGKYIIFSVKNKCYEYVAMSSQISFTKHNGIYGVELFDIIEEKKIFLRYPEIHSFRSQDSITKYEALEDDDWNKLLYDAILNSNPIDIEYDTADRGNPIRRTVLFVTFWYNFFDENDNRKEYSVFQLLEAAAKLKYRTLAQNTRIGYISGYCNYRHDLRTFNIHRIKRGRIFDCRKNLYKVSNNDIWNMLEKGYSDIAINMYNELHEYEQKDLFHLGNYANALVMQGKFNEAMSIFKSIPADTRIPQSTTIWKEACLGDFDYFIRNDIGKANFEKIQLLMQNNGW